MAFVTVYTYSEQIEATIGQSILEDQGFTCLLKDQHIVSMDPILQNAVGGIKLQVHEKDAVLARDVRSTLSYAIKKG